MPVLRISDSVVFPFMNDLLAQAKQTIQNLSAVEQRLSSPEVLGNPREMKETSRAYHRAEELAEAGRSYLELHQAMTDAREASSSDDPEMREMGASEELRLP